jgi:hypothetical protein
MISNRLQMPALPRVRTRELVGKSAEVDEKQRAVACAEW